jgi:hypothetical protein
MGNPFAWPASANALKTAAVPWSKLSYAKLSTLAGNWDTDRPELTKAKAFLKRSDHGEQP